MQVSINVLFGALLTLDSGFTPALTSPYVCMPPSSLASTLNGLPGNIQWALHDCPLDLSPSMQVQTSLEFANTYFDDDEDSFGLSLCCDNGGTSECVDFYRFHGDEDNAVFVSDGGPTFKVVPGAVSSICASPGPLTASLVNCPSDNLRFRFASGTEETIIGLQKVTIQCKMEPPDGTNCLDSYNSLEPSDLDLTCLIDQDSPLSCTCG